MEPPVHTSLSLTELLDGFLGPASGLSILKLPAVGVQGELRSYNQVAGNVKCVLVNEWELRDPDRAGPGTSCWRDVPARIS